MVMPAGRGRAHWRRRPRPCAVSHASIRCDARSSVSAKRIRRSSISVAFDLAQASRNLVEPRARIEPGRAGRTRLELRARFGAGALSIASSPNERRTRRDRLIFHERRRRGMHSAADPLGLGDKDRAARPFRRDSQLRQSRSRSAADIALAWPTISPIRPPAPSYQPLAGRDPTREPSSACSTLFAPGDCPARIALMNCRIGLVHRRKRQRKAFSLTSPSEESASVDDFLANQFLDQPLDREIARDRRRSICGGSCANPPEPLSGRAAPTRPHSSRGALQRLVHRPLRRARHVIEACAPLRADARAAAGASLLEGSPRARSSSPSKLDTGRMPYGWFADADRRNGPRPRTTSRCKTRALRASLR